MKSTSWFWCSLLMFIVCIAHYGRTDAICKRIPLDAVKKAVVASMVAYNKSGELAEDKNMSDTGFKIDKVLSKDYMGVPIVAFSASNKTHTIIAFRGTESGTGQIFDEIKGAIENKTSVQYPASRGRQPDFVKISKYFYEAYEALTALNLLPTGIDENRKYIITGHSLGGALASIFAFHQVRRFPEKNKTFWREDLDNVLITFGQPRVGNIEYAETHDEFIPPYKKLRFAHYKDPVAVIPPSLLNYVHHSTKIMLGEKNDIKVCPQGDEPKGCQNNKISVCKKCHGAKSYKEIIENNTKWMDEFDGSHPTFEQSQCVPRPEVLGKKVPGQGR